MDSTPYTIELKYNSYELKVIGTYDGSTFKTENVEPLYEGGVIVIPSFEDLNEYIVNKKFKKK